MARPTNKSDLLAAIKKERGNLDDYLDSLTPAQMTEPGIVGHWSVKDVLSHLSAWEQMCLGWYRAGLRGEMPQLPAPGYKWNQITELNQHIYEQHQADPLEEVLALFQGSSQEILGLIQQLSDQELFEPGQYAWTDQNALGSYLVSNTSSHYAWARKEIRKGMRLKNVQE